MKILGSWKAAVVLALARSVVACGDADPPGNAFVDYDGRTLVVDGREYRREPPLDYPLVTGRTVVLPRPDGVADALQTIERYGLTVEGRSKEGWLLVHVPAGYEEQWAVALTMFQADRFSATTDPRSSATPIAAQVTAPVAGIPAPKEEPSEADVRRIAIEEYERLEQAGGLPLTMTATGKSFVLHAKVFDARTQSCERLQHITPAQWECTAELLMSICTGDCNPTFEPSNWKAERVRIKWDPAVGSWTLP